jgi:hypothetical protein
VEVGVVAPDLLQRALDVERRIRRLQVAVGAQRGVDRTEEHTSELQSLS